MARYDHLPIAPLFPLYSGFTVAVMPFTGIWKDAVSLAELSRQSEQLFCRSRRGHSLRVLEEAVRRFPRCHKYALGADLRRISQATPKSGVRHAP
jgi:hypothetical protein